MVPLVLEGWGEKRPWQPLLRDTAGLLKWKYSKAGDGQQSSFLPWTTSIPSLFQGHNVGGAGELERIAFRVRV